MAKLKRIATHKNPPREGFGVFKKIPLKAFLAGCPAGCTSRRWMIYAYYKQGIDGYMEILLQAAERAGITERGRNNRIQRIGCGTEVFGDYVRDYQWECREYDSAQRLVETLRLIRGVWVKVALQQPKPVTPGPAAQ